MALTVTQEGRNSIAGGELFDATAYVGTPDEVRVTNDSDLGFIVRYNAASKKLKVFESGNAASDQTPTVDIAINDLQSQLAEVVAATDLSLLRVDLIISGGRA